MENQKIKLSELSSNYKNDLQAQLKEEEQKGKATIEKNMENLQSLTEGVINKNTIKNWFKTGLKPLQTQFEAWMDAYWHKDEDIPMDKIQGLMGVLNDKAATSSVDVAFLQMEENHNSAIQKSRTYTPIHNLISLTQAEYDAIEKKDATTLYFIQ